MSWFVISAIPDHRDGMEKVNDFIEEHDFTDTHQYNGLEDSNLWYGDEDQRHLRQRLRPFPEEIYDGDMVSHLASRQLEGYLLNQDITWKNSRRYPFRDQDRQ